MVLGALAAVAQQVADAFGLVQAVEAHGRLLAQFRFSHRFVFCVTAIVAPARILRVARGRCVGIRLAVVDELERLGQTKCMRNEPLKVLAQVLVREVQIRLESILKQCWTNSRQDVINGDLMVAFDDPRQPMPTEDCGGVDEPILDPRRGVRVTHVDSQFFVDDIVELVEIDDFFRLFSLSVEKSGQLIIRQFVDSRHALNESECDG